MSARRPTSTGLPPDVHRALIERLGRCVLAQLRAEEERERAVLGAAPAANDSAPAPPTRVGSRRP